MQQTTSALFFRFIFVGALSTSIGLKFITIKEFKPYIVIDLNSELFTCTFKLHG